MDRQRLAAKFKFVLNAFNVAVKIADSPTLPRARCIVAIACAALNPEGARCTIATHVVSTAYAVLNSAMVAITLLVAALVALSSVSTHAQAGKQPVFSTATKNIPISTAVESTVFDYNVTTSNNGGVVTNVFIESGELIWPQYDSMRLRVYFDDEPAPSVDAPLGFFDDGEMSPWGTALIGNTGFFGTTYIKVILPFKHRCRMTLTLGIDDSGTKHVHVLISGTEKYGMPTLRTVTQTLDGVVGHPGTSITLFNSSSLLKRYNFTNIAPTLLGMSISAPNASFVSGAVTACVDGACVPMSYGLESFFYASLGFGYSKYALPVAGISSLGLFGQSLIAWRGFDEWPWGATVALMWQVPADAGNVTVSCAVWAQGTLP